MEQHKPTLDQFLARIAALKETNGTDLSTAEDLSLAVMNLISLEEHFFFTGAKTGHDEYFDTSGEIRELRKSLLGELMPHHEGETWCISKHLLSATMRLVEVGNKLQTEGKKEEAKEKFIQAYRVYSIFWALKLKLINGTHVKESAQASMGVDDLVSKLVNCCDE